VLNRICSVIIKESKPSMQQIRNLIADDDVRSKVEHSWDLISRSFIDAYETIPTHFMQREELSFHPCVKLLGYLVIGTRVLEGAIVEIGVWKGKSLAFMSSLADPSTTVIGIDPCFLKGQEEELTYFHRLLFPTCQIIVRRSEEAIAAVLENAPIIKLLHIDGDHRLESVFLDFLIYERFVVKDGYIVFDDYGDAIHSPQVRVAVDRMKDLGLFDGYHIIGPVSEFQNSFVLRKI
jgi:hypothetical protein